MDGDTHLVASVDGLSVVSYQGITTTIISSTSSSLAEPSSACLLYISINRATREKARDSPTRGPGQFKSLLILHRFLNRTLRFTQFFLTEGNLNFGGISRVSGSMIKCKVAPLIYEPNEAEAED